jgi:hypothetical protein
VGAPLGFVFAGAPGVAGATGLALRVPEFRGTVVWADAAPAQNRLAKSAHDAFCQFNMADWIARLRAVNAPVY